VDPPASMQSQVSPPNTSAGDLEQDSPFTDRVRSIAAFDAFQAQQSSGFLAELAGARPTLLAADEPGAEQDTAKVKQRQDRALRIKAARAARQMAEQGAHPSPSEAPAGETNAEPQ